MARDFSHSSSRFLASIDAEIERLQNLREQVASVLDAEEAVPEPVKVKRKGMSPEGRRKVAEAQKARWAKQKREAKATAKKATSAKTTAKKPAIKAAAKKTASKTASVKGAAKSAPVKASSAKTAEQS